MRTKKYYCFPSLMVLVVFNKSTFKKITKCNIVFLMGCWNRKETFMEKQMKPNYRWEVLTNRKY